jgi:hypothetical protein
MTGAHPKHPHFDHRRRGCNRRLSAARLAQSGLRTPDEYQGSQITIHETAGQLRQIVGAELFLSRADAEADLPDQERLNLTIWLSTEGTLETVVKIAISAPENRWSKA